MTLTRKLGPQRIKVLHTLFSTVFKIIKLSPDQFEVVHNLRDLPHKQINLNFSSNDVQWNPRDGKRQLIYFAGWVD